MLLPRIPAKVIHLLKPFVRGVEPWDLPLHPVPCIFATFTLVEFASGFALLITEGINIVPVVGGLQDRGVRLRIRLGPRSQREKKDAQWGKNASYSNSTI